jgi:hypothetical protein
MKRQALKNFGRLDLVVAITLAVIVAAWLVAYAALMILYGHDRGAERAGHDEWRWKATAQIFRPAAATYVDTPPEGKEAPAQGRTRASRGASDPRVPPQAPVHTNLPPYG